MHLVLIKKAQKCSKTEVLQTWLRCFRLPHFQHHKRKPLFCHVILRLPSTVWKIKALHSTLLRNADFLRSKIILRKKAENIFSWEECQESRISVFRDRIRVMNHRQRSTLSLTAFEGQKFSRHETALRNYVLHFGLEKRFLLRHKTQLTFRKWKSTHTCLKLNCLHWCILGAKNMCLWLKLDIKALSLSQHKCFFCSNDVICHWQIFYIFSKKINMQALDCKTLCAVVSQGQLPFIGKVLKMVEINVIECSGLVFSW